MVRKILNLLLALFGYSLVRKSAGSGFTSERISLLGAPNTIIDVGVAGGTREFYKAFPDSHIVLVEPLPETHASKIDSIRNSYPRVTLVEAALGDSDGSAEINLELGGSSRSSMMERTDLTAMETKSEKRTVPIRRLDSLCLENEFESPFGIKIDTEGYELNVVKGCDNILEKIDFFIMEVSVAQRFKDSYTFEELVAHMDSIGFRMTDMLDFARPDAVGTRFMDLVFKKK